jgi:hypothetical protein
MKDTTRPNGSESSESTLRSSNCRGEKEREEVRRRGGERGGAYRVLVFVFLESCAESSLGFSDKKTGEKNRGR